MGGEPPADRGGNSGPAPGSRTKAAWSRLALMACPVLLVLCAEPAEAASNNVRITKLSDVAFGTLLNLSADAVRTQDICAFANTATNGYTVRASGSGSGGGFSLASASGSLPFELQWNDTAGQGSGTPMTANVALAGQVSAATQQTCNSGPAFSASLIVILRSAALSSAAAGSYNGSVTLVIGPE